MSKDRKPSTLGTISSQGIKKVTSQTSTESLSAVDQIEVITKSQAIVTGSIIEQVESIDQVQTEAVIDQVHEIESLHSLFEHLLSEQAPALKLIKMQVSNGVLSEDQAEEKLLLMMLSQSMNLPTVIAEQILPEFKQSVSELEELRNGLKVLWQK